MSVWDVYVGVGVGLCGCWCVCVRERERVVCGVWVFGCVAWICEPLGMFIVEKLHLSL